MKTLMHHFTAQPRLSAELKIMTTLVFTFLIVTDQHLVLAELLCYLLYIASFILIEKLNPSKVIRLSMTFFVFFAVTAVLGPLSAGDWERALNLFIKGLLSMLLLASLNLSTDFPSLMRAIRRMGVPSIFVSIMSLTYRYFFLLIEEAGRIQLARNCRSLGRGYSGQFKVLGNMIGNLFIRTYERGERIHSAMLARGYTGEIPELKEKKVSRFNMLFGAWTFAAFLGMGLWRIGCLF